MKNNHCIIGLDVGTSSVKAIAVDLEGNQLAGSRKSLTLHCQAPHQYLQDVNEVTAGIFEVLKKVSEKVANMKIETVGITGQSVSLILLDQNNIPLFPIINHLDIRSTITARKIERKTGPLGYIGTKVLANLVWIKETRPDIWRDIKHVFDVKEYAGYLLTGEKSSDKIWYFIEDLETAFKNLEVPSNLLGPPKSFTDVLGYVTPESALKTGIPAGTPVVISLGDSLTCPFGSGVREEGDMADVCGATEIMAAATRDVRGVDSYPYILNGLKLVSYSPPIGLMHQWFVMTLSQIAGVDLSTAYNMFEEYAAREKPGANGLIFLPGSFTGSPKMISMGLTRLTFANTIGQLARAFYECITFELNHTVEVFRAAGVPISKIIVSGGGATTFLCQLKADVLGLEVDMPNIMETGCFGAALIAGYAVGLYNSLEEAVSKVKIKQRFKPSHEYDYGERYREYIDVRQSYGQTL